MKIRLFLPIIFLIVLFSDQTSGQVAFQEKVKFLTYSEPGKMIELPSGDIILQGVTSMNGSPQHEFFLRMNSTGSIIWNRQFLDSSNFYQLNAYMWLDSNGIIHSIGSICTDLDTNGNIISRKNISYPVISAQPYGIGYIATNNAFIYEMDSIYNVASTAVNFNVNSIPLNNYRDIGLKKTYDNGFIYFGRLTNSPSQSSESKAFVVKLDSALQIQWYKSYKFSSSIDSSFSFEDLIQLSSGEYMITLAKESLHNKLYAVKLDNNGDIIWSKSISTNLFSAFYFHPFEDTVSGKYILTMNVSLAFPQTNIGIMQTDSAFNILSTTYYIDGVSNAYHDNFTEIMRLNSGHYLLKSIKYSGGQPYDIFLMKTDSSLLTGCNDITTTFSTNPESMIAITDTFTTSIIPITFSSTTAATSWSSNASVLSYCQSTNINSEIDDLSLSISPNPFQNSILINANFQDLSNVSIIIKNYLGQEVLVLDSNDFRENYSNFVDLHLLSHGIYYLLFTVNKKTIVKKIIKL